jgi:hypothetical protein
MDPLMTNKTNAVFLRFFFGNARDDVIGLDMDFFFARLISEINIVSGQNRSHQIVSTWNEELFRAAKVS